MAGLSRELGLAVIATVIAGFVLGLPRWEMALVAAGIFGLAVLSERQRPAARRTRAAKKTLSAWVRHGFELRTRGTTATQVLQWASRLCDVVSAMFGEAEGSAFMTHIPGYAGPTNAAEREDWIARVNAALGDLIRRTDALPVMGSFRAKEWQP